MLPALLGGCGGGDGPPVPTDPVLERHFRAGHAAIGLDQPAQAIRHYSEALARARARDDAAAIGDLAFNLVVTQERAGQPEIALRTFREVSAELARRNATIPPALRLAGAIALYRLGRLPQADAAAAAVEPGSDPEIAMRAAFLRGLVADENGDAAGLRRAFARLAAAKAPEGLGDQSELAARIALRERDPRRARAEAERAAALRRDLLDYRALARCLALAARAAEETGDPAAAADLYLRAGRSATAQGEKPSAREWLSRAIALSRDAALSSEARAALAGTNQ
jgi:hypothetical protein